jgi:hypothetical protein
MKPLRKYCAIAFLSILSLAAQAGGRSMIVIADLDHGPPCNENLSGSIEIYFP